MSQMRRNTHVTQEMQDEAARKTDRFITIQVKEEPKKIPQGYGKVRVRRLFQNKRKTAWRPKTA